MYKLEARHQQFGFLLCLVLAACRMHKDPQEDDKKAAIAVVLAHELAVQSYDFDKVDSLHTADARVIEESYPHAFEPDAALRVEYHAQDAVADV